MMVMLMMTTMMIIVKRRFGDVGALELRATLFRIAFRIAKMDDE